VTDTPSSLVLVFGTDDDSIAPGLEACRRAIATYPIAAQAIFAALVAEGRRYVRTDEGRELARQLAESVWTQRARMVWETVSLTSLSEDDGAVLPSTCVEAVLNAARSEGLESLLSRLFFDDSP
jgi:hypothetical protein